MKKLILISAIIFTFLTNLFSQNTQKYPDAYAAPTVKAFAQDLYTNGFLDEAESEFRRYLFMSGTNDIESIQSLSYIYNEKNNLSGINWLCDNFYTGTLTKENLLMKSVQGRLIFKQRNLDDYLNFTNTIVPLLIPENVVFTNLVNICTLLLQQNIEDAKNAAAFANESAPETFGGLNNLFLSYKYKKPGLALFLSMLVPGSGKWYAGSIKTGFTSFLSVGGFIGTTVYYGITTKWKSWQPYVFGSLSLILYITDVYGSYQAAKRYNEAEYRHLCEEADKIHETLY